MHRYLATCFGCEYDRGSGYLGDVQAIHDVRTLPIDELRAYDIVDFDEFTSVMEPHAFEPAYRQAFYERIRMSDGPAPTWKPPGSRLNYVGGLEGHPHGEYATFSVDGGVLTVDGDRSRSRIASVPLINVLSVTAYPALDSVLGGATVGLISDGGAFMTSVEPTAGGGLRIVFSDDASIWRVLLIGNRTGLTDSRFQFEAYQAWATLLGRDAHWLATREEWAIGPQEYARNLGFDVDEVSTPPSEDTKVCPDCAETVKAAARVCRFCRYEFADA